MTSKCPNCGSEKLMFLSTKAYDFFDCNTYFCKNCQTYCSGFVMKYPANASPQQRKEMEEAFKEVVEQSGGKIPEQ
jgi:hypothetical protein